MNMHTKPDSRVHDARRRELARIHLLKRDLRLDDECYGDVLFTVARVRSAADLDAHGRKAVIRHMSSRLPHGQRRAGAKGYPGEPRTLDKRPLLQKIGAQLADAGRPWSYAEALAKRIAHKDRLRFCSDAELSKIVAALAIDAKRHGVSRPRG
jgi:phage gp16-like protein